MMLLSNPGLWVGMYVAVGVLVAHFRPFLVAGVAGWLAVTRHGMRPEEVAALPLDMNEEVAVLRDVWPVIPVVIAWPLAPMWMIPAGQNAAGRWADRREVGEMTCPRCGRAGPDFVGAYRREHGGRDGLDEPAPVRPVVPVVEQEFTIAAAALDAFAEAETPGDLVAVMLVCADIMDAAGQQDLAVTWRAAASDLARIYKGVSPDPDQWNEAAPRGGS